MIVKKGRFAQLTRTIKITLQTHPPTEFYINSINLDPFNQLSEIAESITYNKGSGGWRLGKHDIYAEIWDIYVVY